jgi:hypothetical protein
VPHSVGHYYLTKVRDSREGWRQPVVIRCISLPLNRGSATSSNDHRNVGWHSIYIPHRRVAHRQSPTCCSVGIMARISRKTKCLLDIETIKRVLETGRKVWRALSWP